jgi:hypothetical protein
MLRPLLLPLLLLFDKRRNVSSRQNAAPEWQAAAVCGVRYFEEACPLEGFVRPPLHHQRNDFAHILSKQHPYELANPLQKT